MIFDINIEEINVGLSTVRLTSCIGCRKPQNLSLRRW